MYNFLIPVIMFSFYAALYRCMQLNTVVLVFNIVVCSLTPFYLILHILYSFMQFYLAFYKFIQCLFSFYIGFRLKQ